MNQSSSSQINFKVLASVLGVMAVLLTFFSTALASDPVAESQTEELSKMKTAGVAMYMYTADNDEMMPPAVGLDNEGQPMAYFMAISPYIKNFEMLQSPFDTVSETVGFTPTQTGRISFGVNGYLMPQYLDGTPLILSSIASPEKVIMLASAPQFMGQKERMSVLPPQPCALLGKVSKTSYVTKYPNNWMNIGNMVGIPENGLSFTSTKPLEDLLENKANFVSWSGNRTTIGMADSSARRTPNPKLLISIQASKTDNLWDPYRQGCAP